ncbi:concanavalin A-like lectin/glucanases superfamily protein [Burkholderia pseudomallei K42]|nr:concanavalin A-like lectin/glucanases superfamily protein [Burkholderia pseudomallei K42]
MLKITGYSDEISVAPGQSIKFMVNCELPEYQTQIIRIICGDSNPQGPGVKEVAIDSPVTGVYRGRPQKILAGSYGLVEHTKAMEDIQSFSLQAWIFPTTPAKGVQSIVAKYDEANCVGFALVIDAEGSAGVLLADGKQIEVLSTGKKLVPWEWYFVAASFDAASSTVTLVQSALVDYATIDDSAVVVRKASVQPVSSEAPVTFAANQRGDVRGWPLMSNFYNGKIDAPKLVRRALSLEEIHAVQGGSAPAALRADVIGSWDFSREIATIDIVDTSSFGHHGLLTNMPVRAVPGHAWTGEHHDWKTHTHLWSAIHFHDDDLSDARWEADFQLTIPDTMRSGLYAAKLTAGEHTEYIPFAVRPIPGKEAKICFLLPTASYMAYANEHFATNPWGGELMWYRATVLNPDHIFLNEHREYGHSCYDRHSDNSPVYYSSRLRPILNMRPSQQCILGGFGSSLWQFNADTHIIDWLTEQGFDFDVVTDEDVHYGGLAQLDPYNVVITGSHPEYYSKQMWDAVYDFTQQGGRLMYLGANGFYWRCGFHQSQRGVLEIRRAEGGSRASEPPTGEYYLSTTGEYSGLWRRQGRRSPQVIAGVGFTAEGFDVSSYYRQTPARDNPRVKWMFEGIARDELLGDFGLIGGGAAGLELDRVDRNLGTPPHALVVASSEAHTDAYMLVVEELFFNLPGCSGSECDWVRGDICFYETPNGGAVWSVGSIAYAGSLSHNDYENNVSKLTRNVLTRFVDPARFDMPR